MKISTVYLKAWRFHFTLVLFIFPQLSPFFFSNKCKFCESRNKIWNNIKKNVICVQLTTYAAFVTLFTGFPRQKPCTCHTISQKPKVTVFCCTPFFCSLSRNDMCHRSSEKK